MDTAIMKKEYRKLKILVPILFPKKGTFSFDEEKNQLLEKYLKLGNTLFKQALLLLGELIELLKKVEIPIKMEYKISDKSEKIYMLWLHPERVKRN